MKYAQTTIIVLFVLGVGFWLHTAAAPVGTNTNLCTGTYTEASTTVGTSVAAVLTAAQTSRGCKIRLQNDSALNVYCAFDGTTTAASSSIKVNTGLKLGAASTTFQGPESVDITDDNGFNYAGNVNCVSSASTTILIHRR
jgi:hypothetical protein